MKLNYQPSIDVPDQAGKVFVITGGTDGIGRSTILQLIPHNLSHVIFTGRSQAKADQVIAEAIELSTPNSGNRVTFVPCDLSDLDSVKEAGQAILRLTDKIHVFVANAAKASGDVGLTKQGYELYFGTNHVGHAALIHILLPIIDRTSQSLPESTPARIVTLSSDAIGLVGAAGIEFAHLKTSMTNRYWILPTFRLYAHSKLANHLYSLELASRYPSILCIAINPGMVRTDNTKMLPFPIRILYATSSAVLEGRDRGAWNSLWAATCDIEYHGGWQRLQGGFFDPVGEDGKVVLNSQHASQGVELWDWTTKELEGHNVTIF